uniref:hypothetical protein n=1 Tax=Paenibacillus koleovorans TaxID=121608 RepID=UPI0027D8DA60|nr:hypothetical protein [Paenibacillus koleovorans]
MTTVSMRIRPEESAGRINLHAGSRFGSRSNRILRLDEQLAVSAKYGCSLLRRIILFLLCDEVGTMDWAIALQQLLDLINEVATKAGRRLSALIQRQLQQWMSALPIYIKA